MYDFVISGAGISGVILSKYLRENNISFLTLEKRDGIGGLWYYSDDPNVTSVTKKTITTSSKRFTHFSDYAPDEGCSEFMKWSELLEHIRGYAKKFDIMGNVQLNAEVEKVVKNGDGKWEVSYRVGDFSKTVICKNFVVGGGAQSQKRTPLADKFGSKFDGEIYHSQEVKLNGVIKFKGKRVLVTGGGETASDMAMHAACVADKTVWAIPDGLHSIDRASGVEVCGEIREFVWDEGPSLKRNRFHTQHLSDKMHNNLFIIHNLLGANGHGIKEWLVDNYYYNKFPIKDGEVIYMVHKGKIAPKRDIIDISNKIVRFSDGTSEEIDMIIECIGYKKSFDYFTETNLRNIDYNKLYRGFIHQEEANLFLLGMVRPMIGSVPGFVEYQSQYIVDLHKGKIHLPNKEMMLENFNNDEKYHRELFAGCARYRHDVRDGIYHYPYVLSKDMGRDPVQVISSLPPPLGEFILNAPLNSGLFLWINDVAKRTIVTNMKSAHVSIGTQTLRHALLLYGYIGMVMDPLLRLMDKYIFGKKNEANLLFYGIGNFHRLFLIEQKIPVSYGMILNHKGPFPINHPYFRYMPVTFWSTTNYDRSVLLSLILLLCFGMHFVASAFLSVPNQIICILIARLGFQKLMFPFQIYFYYKLPKIEVLQIIALIFSYFVAEALYFNKTHISNIITSIFYLLIMGRVWSFKTLSPRMREDLE